MKYFFVIWLTLFCSNVFAGEFKKFYDYKDDIDLLQNDIGRLESFKTKKNDKIYEDTLVQYKFLLENYKLIHSHMTLRTLVSDAVENGWRATAAKTRDFIKLCEGHNVVHSQCIQELNQLKIFVNNSGLKDKNKESISRFIDKYIVETTDLAVFDEHFISSFDQNSMLVNQKIASEIIVIESPPAKIFAPQFLEVEKKKRDYLFFAGALLFFAGALIFHNRNRKKNAVRKFYRRIFQAGYNNKMKVKLFGYIDFSGLAIMHKIEKPFLDSIICSQEAHIKFKNKKQELRIETFFTGGPELLKEALENLQKAVDDCNGQCVYSNEYSIQGEIVESKLSLIFPTE